MGSGIGQTDKNATNDMLNGQVVATGTPGAQTVPDPNRGLNESQMRNRRFLGATGKAFSSLANPAQSPAISGTGANFSFANNQPNLQLPPPAPDQSPFQNYMPLSKGARNPFFG